jgi:threonine dehydratase
MSDVTASDIDQAQVRLNESGLIERTPIEKSRSLGDRCEATVHLKMEHLQRTGSFKPRGALNCLARVQNDPTIDRVVAASAGNHAQGVALAASQFGMDALIVMPEAAPQTKIDATREYGATVALEGEDFHAACEHARNLASDPEKFLVHPYDDPAIIAGQGTLGIEILEQVPDVDTIIVPIGGGGLIGGVAAAIADRKPSVRVVGVQSEGAATVPESLRKGSPVSIDDPVTIADGIATGSVSERTFELIKAHVDSVVLVSDDDIATAIRFLIEHAKQVVEGAGATSVAALLSGELDVNDECVIPLLCGGNIDTTTLQEVLTHAMVEREQLVELVVRIDDRPGKMGTIASIIGDQEANIRTVRHERSRPDLPIGYADLVFEVATTGRGHLSQVIDSLRSADFEVKRQ